MAAAPTTLRGLSTREAISDAIYRAVLGLDTTDKALFDSAFMQDASFDLDRNVMVGPDKIATGCYDGIPSSAQPASSIMRASM